MSTGHYDRDNLTDYLHGELAPDADAVLFAHLEACRPCTRLYEEEVSLGELLRTQARSDELEFPSMIKARVWDAVRQEKPSWVARLRAWGPFVAVPAAALVAVAAYLGTPIWRHAGQPVGVEAAYFLDQHNAQSMQNPFGPGAAPAVYTADSQDRNGSAAASYIDTADAATIDNASGAYR